METKRQLPEPLKIEPALLTILQVCRLINVQRATFYKLRVSGRFAPLPVQLCHKVLYKKQEVLDWISAGCPHRKIWQAIKENQK